MWGQHWGQMVWGGTQRVPAMAFWGLALVALLLVVLGRKFLQARPRTVGAVTLALLLALPLTATALNLPFSFSNGTVADATQVNANFAALAQGRLYGFVRANGTVHPDLNGGIVDVANPFAGYYCFKLGASARNAVATLDAQQNTTYLITTYVPRDGAVGLSGCPAGYNDATVIVKTTNGALVNGAFFIWFQ